MIDTQESLDGLFDKYLAKEEEALGFAKIPDDNYLCIRLDGVRATKSYLKDTLVNDDFRKCLTEAIRETHRLLRHNLNRDFTNSFVCGMSVNDEVSFILYNKNDNYEKRVFKLCTMFSGVLSAFFSRLFNSKKIVAFDARPIFLTSQREIDEYLWYRYLLSVRYGHWKILRLNGYENVNDDSIKGNLDKCRSLVHENGWGHEFKIIQSHTLFHLPTREQEPVLNCKTMNNRGFTEEVYKDDIHCYLEYLSREKRLPREYQKR